MSVSLYAVVHIERSTGNVIAIAGRSMWFNLADRMAGDLTQRATPGTYFTARNENELQ